ncbi:MAG: AsmA-like C-terminal region-containing protein [Thermoguttaceae bacterium]
MGKKASPRLAPNPELRIPSRQPRKVPPILARAINCCWFGFKWTVALLLIGGAAAAFLFYRHIDEEIRRQAVAQIAKHYPGLRVSVGSAQRVEGKGVRVFDVVIAEPRAGGPPLELLRIEEMMLECPTDWQRLVQGDLPISHVTIRRPVLGVTRRADDTWSVAKLLQSVDGGGPTPPVTIENGVVEISDPRRTPASRLTLRDVNLTILPAAAVGQVVGPANPAMNPGRVASPPRTALRQIKGTFAGDGLRHAELEGTANLRTRAFSVHGRAQGIDVSPELRAALPDEVCRKLAPVGPFELRGQAELAFNVAYDPGATPAVRYNVVGQLERGRVDTPQLPHALTEIHATFRADNGGASIEDLTARAGQGTLQLAYRQTGFDLNAPRFIVANFRQLQLDRGLWDVLSPRLQEQWQKYLPAGSVDADLRLDYDGRTWRPRVTVTCLNVSFAHHKFPYRMERARGIVDLKDDRLTLDLTAYIGTRPTHLTAEIDHALSAPSGWFEAKGDEILLDETLLAALPEQSRALAHALDIRGTVNFGLRVWRDRPDEPVHQHLHIDLNGCWVRYAKFPYPLSNVRGGVDVIDGAWTLQNLVGVNNTARVTCNGSMTPAPQGHELALNFDALNVPLDEQLRDALATNVQQVWQTIQPRGVVDLTVDVRYLVEQKKFGVGVRALPQPQTTSIEPIHFPYRLDRLDGALFYRDGRLTFEHCKAEHGPVKLATDGYCDLTNDGQWHVHLENLTVDRLRADRELIRALPDRLKRTADVLNANGLLNLRGSIDIEHDGPPTDPARWQWNLNVGLQQAGLRCGGLSFDNVCGAVTLTGRFDREQAQSRGELAIDSLTYRDCQLTQIRGPIWIDDSRVLFGVWVDRPDGGATMGALPRRTPRPVTAGLFGGTFYGDGWVMLGPEPRYRLEATLQDADLARCAQELAGRHRLRGKVFATADLSGTGWSRNAMSGGGKVRLSEGNVYELPVMISLLKLLSIRPADQSAFSDAMVNYRVEGEHIYFDRIDFRGDAVSLRGKGEMDSQSAIRLTFYTLVGRGELDLPVIKQVLRGASQQLVLIHVDGTLQEPRTRQEALPALSQALQQLRDELQSRR